MISLLRLGGGNPQAQPTLFDLICHGHAILRIDIEQQGAKVTLWAFFCRHRYNILLTLLWWYWSRSSAQAYTMFLITHVPWEISLWYKIGELYSHTYGRKDILASPQKRKLLKCNKTEKQNDRELTSSTTKSSCATKAVQRINSSAQTTAQKTYQTMASNLPPSINRKQKKSDQPTQIYIGSKMREEPSQPPLQKQFRELASKILSTNKGKRKNIDRPERYRNWQKQSNARLLSAAAAALHANVSTQYSLQDNANLIHRDTATYLVSQQQNDTSIDSPITNILDEAMQIQQISTTGNDNHLNKRMSICHTKRMKSNVFSISFMRATSKKMLKIHNKQNHSRADCGAWLGVWANVGSFHQHQRDLTRATSPVLDGFYPRDFIKWI